MTKKDDTATENTLEKKLEEIQEEKQNQEESEKNEEITKLQNKIAQLEKEKLEGQEITKKAQYDYINLKADFDRFQRQTAEATKSNEKDALIKSVKKLLPFVEELRKSLDHITADKQTDPFFQGIKIVYDKLLKTLESLNIKPIQSI
jgi:molecular chaperone GrpE